MKTEAELAEETRKKVLGVMPKEPVEGMSFHAAMDAIELGLAIGFYQCMKNIRPEEDTLARCINVLRSADDHNRVIN